MERIRKSSKPEQLSYTPTELIPVDVATRSISASKLQNSIWLHGSHNIDEKTEKSDVVFPVESQEHDKEIRPHIKVVKTELQNVNAP